jgi:hypothetical protein
LVEKEIPSLGGIVFASNQKSIQLGLVLKHGLADLIGFFGKFQIIVHFFLPKVILCGDTLSDQLNQP